MGDYFERIVDVEVSADEAGATAARLVEWMLSCGLLSAETSGDGVYSLNVDQGYLPGPQWRRIAQEWGDDWRPGPVAVVVGREDHHGGQGEIEPESATCPSCGATTVIIDYPQRWEADPEVWRPFGAAIDQWKQTGTGLAGCGRCGMASPVTEWRWPSGFALGALAFDFWGWPPLTDDFVAEFAARLGHRVEHHSGKF
ncbi:hypothetical protein [Nocardia cyriacigeorgica]|uniref:hypothetical protein n=1 Tax=Nocardia cyriacigeorgica TaxID=135487 RepID=UPI001894FED9|nr:hypothetical protein [Nocardia cyriacigeorgica]MBF6411597.1 hypothetical protein [Nocardia cyriacigeorgica]